MCPQGAGPVPGPGGSKMNPWSSCSENRIIGERFTKDGDRKHGVLMAPSPGEPLVQPRGSHEFLEGLLNRVAKDKLRKDESF